MDGQLLFAWVWILMGLVTGALAGLFFARADWLGGYGSWPRRLVRLGHISFVGTGLLNVAALWTLDAPAAAPAVAHLVRATFLGGAIAMPLCCYLAAALPAATRALFALPVASLCTGSLALLLILSTVGGPV